ncbi:hypothetical protein GGD70_008172 [Paraburkholderia fungorum]|nr:hypothetical protein [Paraburkholderia fungorum]
MGDETASRTRQAAAVVRAIDILRSVPMPAARLTDDISRWGSARRQRAASAAHPRLTVGANFLGFPNLSHQNPPLQIFPAV